MTTPHRFNGQELTEIERYPPRRPSKEFFERLERTIDDGMRDEMYVVVERCKRIFMLTAPPELLQLANTTVTDLIERIKAAKDLCSERALAYDKMGQSDESKAWAEQANLLLDILSSGQFIATPTPKERVQ